MIFDLFDEALSMIKDWNSMEDARKKSELNEKLVKEEMKKIKEEEVKEKLKKSIEEENNKKDICIGIVLIEDKRILNLILLNILKNIIEDIL